MYHEEKVINDVLCWRGTPNGEWIKYSDNVLTDRFVELRARLAKAEAVIEAAGRFVYADGRHNPPEKYQELKTALEAYKAEQ
jgi:hypothetical protein